MNRKLISYTLLISSVFLSINIIGCGQSGPLVLPKPTVAPTGTTPSTTATDNESTTVASPAPPIKTVN